MPKNLFHIFHADDASLSLGTLAAVKSQAQATETGVEVQVFCFGPALQALAAEDADGAVRAYNENIDSLVEAGIVVAACLNAATAAGIADGIVARGIVLESAVDVFARCAVDGTNIITF